MKLLFLILCNLSIYSSVRYAQCSKRVSILMLHEDIVLWASYILVTGPYFTCRTPHLCGAGFWIPAVLSSRTLLHERWGAKIPHASVCGEKAVWLDVVHYFAIFRTHHMNQEVGSHKTNLLVVTCSSCYITLVGTANSPRFCLDVGKWFELWETLVHVCQTLVNFCKFLKWGFSRGLRVKDPGGRLQGTINISHPLTGKKCMKIKKNRKSWNLDVFFRGHLLRIGHTTGEEKWSSEAKLH